MNLRLLLAACVAALSVLVATPAGSASAASYAASARTCTHTSSGTCIRGGGFCPQASYNRSGWDAAGRRYVCKGDRVHPHWMKP